MEEENHLAFFMELVSYVSHIQSSVLRGVVLLPPTTFRTVERRIG